jgi:hypothetical protein
MQRYKNFLILCNTKYIKIKNILPSQELWHGKTLYQGVAEA